MPTLSLPHRNLHVIFSSPTTRIFRNKTFNLQSPFCTSDGNHAQSDKDRESLPRITIIDNFLYSYIRKVSVPSNNRPKQSSDEGNHGGDYNPNEHSTDLTKPEEHGGITTLI